MKKGRLPVGVFTETDGSWQQPVAYLSKKLDPGEAGWLLGLRALAATILLTKEADKLILGWELHVKTPHAIVSLMNTQTFLFSPILGAPLWKSMTHSQSSMDAESSNFPTFEEGEPDHDCFEVTNGVFISCPDPYDQVLNKTQNSPYSVMTAASLQGPLKKWVMWWWPDEILEAGALPIGWSPKMDWITCSSPDSHHWWRQTSQYLHGLLICLCYCTHTWSNL